MSDRKHSMTAFNSSHEIVDTVLAKLGGARFVLIGEASHGTHEFYELRAEITKALIERAGFMAVAVEADWPDAYQVNRYVQGTYVANSAEEALGCFERFPTWMWRNTVVRDFVHWLEQHNRPIRELRSRAGFYGLDLYSLHDSMRAVVSYLDTVDPEAAKRARYRYACFDHAGEDPQAYGYAATFGMTKPCFEAVTKQLRELQEKHAAMLQEIATPAEDELFYAEQNARLAVNAEEYYRSMFLPRQSSWNLRDAHMSETLTALAQHLERTRGKRAKIVVWAHNSHLGDARATEMGEGGEINLGQLTREQFGGEAFLLGFTSYTGTVTAANNWDEPPQLKRVRPGLPNSYEEYFHELALRETSPNFLLDLRHGSAEIGAKLERAIGVIYRPSSERVSHYFNARIRDQFDAVIHFDETHALEPLDADEHWRANDSDELPETYPSGL